jgi:hypothetical protein
MNCLHWIVAWYVVGFICLILGIVFDFLLYGKKPEKAFSFYFFPIVFGFVCVPVLIRSVYRGIRIKFKI